MYRITKPHHCYFPHSVLLEEITLNQGKSHLKFAIITNRSDKIKIIYYSFFLQLIKRS